MRDFERRKRNWTKKKSLLVEKKYVSSLLTTQSTLEKSVRKKNPANNDKRRIRSFSNSRFSAVRAFHSTLTPTRNIPKCNVNLRKSQFRPTTRRRRVKIEFASEWCRGMNGHELLFWRCFVRRRRRRSFRSCSREIGRYLLPFSLIYDHHWQALKVIFSTQRRLLSRHSRSLSRKTDASAFSTINLKSQKGRP